MTEEATASEAEAMADSEPEETPEGERQVPFPEVSNACGKRSRVEGDKRIGVLRMKGRCSTALLGTGRTPGDAAL